MNQFSRLSSHCKGTGLQHVPSCPITHSLPTTMLAETFARMCAGHQQTEYTYCADICRGGILPRNLMFIDKSETATIVNTRKGEPAMTSRKSGICDLCGGDKNISTIYDRKVCSTCAFTVSDAKLRPELVVSEVQRLWGDRYFPKQDVSSGSSILAEEIANRDLIIEDQLTLINQRNEEMTEVFAKLDEANYRIEELDEKLASMQPLQVSGSLE